MADYPVKVVGREPPFRVSLEELELQRDIVDAAPNEPTDAIVELMEQVLSLMRHDDFWRKINMTLPSEYNKIAEALDRLRTACPELVRMAEKEKGDG